MLYIYIYIYIYICLAASYINTTVSFKSNIEKNYYCLQGGWQRPLILPLFGFPWSRQLRNLSIIRELWRACAKRAWNNNNFNNKKFGFAAIPQWSEYSLLVLLVIGLVSALTNFYRFDVELSFSFLLAVYYAKNESSERSLFLDARPFDSLRVSRCRLSSCVSV